MICVDAILSQHTTRTRATYAQKANVFLQLAPSSATLVVPAATQPAVGRKFPRNRVFVERLEAYVVHAAMSRVAGGEGSEST